MRKKSRTGLPEETLLERLWRRAQSEETRDHWIEILAAVVLALATVATAWSAYQSSLWSGQNQERTLASAAALGRVSHFTTLEQVTLSLHATLFAQWSSAITAGNTRQADFLVARFPEPLKAATVAWLAMDPLTNPAAPATPFAMPVYALTERAQVERWQATVVAETTAAAAAGAIADRYLLFTIIFASALFFGGICGKFRSQAINGTMLGLSWLILLAGVATMLALPIWWAG